MKISHIVIASDLSQLARHAYPVALSLAAAYGARLTLLHVDDLDEMIPPESASEKAFRDQVAGLRRELLERDRKELSHVLEQTDVAVVKGRAADAIPAYCDAHDVDLLVLSKYGHRGKATLPGATTVTLLNAAKLPMLVVHVDPETVEEGGLPDELAAAEISNIFAPTDFSPDSARGVKAAHAIAQQFNGALRIAHVLRKPFFAHLQLPESSLEQLRVSSEEKLTQHLASLHLDGDVTAHVVLGDHPAPTLAGLTEKYSADLVVIPTHGEHARRDLIGHTTHDLVQLSTRPVLVLPRTSQADG